MKNLLYLFCLLCLPFSKIFGQKRPALRVESSLHYGIILNHTPRITIQTGQAIWGQEIGLLLQTHGEKDWQVLQHFPAFGLSALHFNWGEGAHGHAFALVPHINVPFFRKKWGLAGFRLGTGMGYVSRPYDYFTNPGQNAIGSHWNNVVTLRFSGEGSISAHARVSAGFSFTHFSNGGAHQPNFGINAPAGFASLTYAPTSEPAFLRREVSRKPVHRLGFFAHTGAAWIEYVIFDGPRYPVWAFSGSAFVYLNKTNRVHVGLDFERNGAVYAWGLHSTAFPDETTARLRSSRLAWFLADEFLFGPVGIHLQTGFYTGERRNAYVLTSFYNKLMLRWYFPPLAGQRLRPHVGICLKSHLVIAEYISMNAGLAF